MSEQVLAILFLVVYFSVVFSSGYYIGYCRSRTKIITTLLDTVRKEKSNINSQTKNVSS